MLNRPAELVTQLAILNQLSKFGGEQRFLNTFCGAKQTPWGRSYIGASQLTTLRNKMRNIWLRRTKADLKSSLPQKHIIMLKKATVMTNSKLTKNARDLAKENAVVVYEKLGP